VNKPLNSGKKIIENLIKLTIKKTALTLKTGSILLNSFLYLPKIEQRN